jgi:hypothetical protein
MADVPLESIRPIPVVRPEPTTFTMVPAVVELAFISTNPPSMAEVLVKIPVEVSEMMPLVAMAPVPAATTRIREPVVMADEPLAM